MLPSPHCAIARPLSAGSSRPGSLKVLLPAAAPSIFAGMRLGLIFCMLGVVASELIAAEAGIGQLIAQYSASFRLSEVYAIILALVVVAAALNSLSEHLERRLTRWRPPAQSSKGGN